MNLACSRLETWPTANELKHMEANNTFKSVEQMLIISSAAHVARQTTENWRAGNANLLEFQFHGKIVNKEL